jgi:hypothetical protein
MNWLLFFSVLSTSSFAQVLPKGCDLSELGKFPEGKERVERALNQRGSGKVEPNVKVKAREKGISRSDLDKEIVYFNPLTKKCSFEFVKNTPFGKWAKRELDWRQLQKLVPLDLSYKPIEGKGVAYDSATWRTFTLTQQANLFDRRAANGYEVIVEEASECQKNKTKSDIRMLKEFSEQFQFLYNDNLKDFLP